MRALFDALRRHACRLDDGSAFDDGTTQLGYAPLARRVAGAAEELLAKTSPTVVGILGGNQIDTIVGQLAIWYAGRTAVPLPSFFRVPQLLHLVQDAEIGHILCTSDMVGTARLLGVPFSTVSTREASLDAAPRAEASQIIYTSGSTGLPKGVFLRSEQIMWSARALACATDARDTDVYLSLLPLPLLLETLGAVVVPILAGARVCLEPALSENFADADGKAIAKAVAARRPSCMLLVPQLLSRWLVALDDPHTDKPPPSSLRFVAVGGAPVSAALAEQAWENGIPVYEGYGLSECCSVVALNRPSERKPGTVGKVLPGIDVRIEAGEIVVRGPCVMDRYLHGEPTGGVWRTGDLGELDADGTLTVRGRVDNRLVTPIGRNISPEWIEALLLADSRVGHCLLTDMGGDHLTAIIVPSAQGEDWFEAASADDASALVVDRCREAPSYAVPQRFAILPSGELARFGLLTANGRIRRKQTLEAYAAMFKSGDIVSTPLVQPDHQR